MAKIRCEKLSDGLRQSEALIVVKDASGRSHSIRVERDFLSNGGSHYFLPIGIVYIDQKSKKVLIEFPHEAESGANRIWVDPVQLDEPVEALV